MPFPYKGTKFKVFVEPSFRDTPPTVAPTPPMPIVLPPSGAAPPMPLTDSDSVVHAEEAPTTPSSQETEAQETLEDVIADLQVHNPDVLLKHDYNALPLVIAGHIADDDARTKFTLKMLHARLDVSIADMGDDKESVEVFNALDPEKCLPRIVRVFKESRQSFEHTRPKACLLIRSSTERQDLLAGLHRLSRMPA